MSGVVDIGKGLLGMETDAEKAAKSAAGAQVKGSELATAEQRRQFDITQESLQPFQSAGTDALEQQRILMGLGASAEVDPNAKLRADLEGQLSGQDGSADGSFGSGGMGGMLSGLVNSLLSKNREGIQSQLDAIPEFTPTVNPLSASEQQQQAFDQFNQSPGQQFLRDRAQKNLIRNQAAIGGLGGGNVRSALVQQGIGFAQQDFNNQFGRLGQMAGQGQAAATNVGQFGAQAAQSIGNNLVQSGQARASGILGAQQAKQQGFNNAVNLGMGAYSLFSPTSALASNPSRTTMLT
jgi:hypothetical protein